LRCRGIGEVVGRCARPIPNAEGKPDVRKKICLVLKEKPKKGKRERGEKKENSLTVILNSKGGTVFGTESANGQCAEPNKRRGD